MGNGASLADFDNDGDIDFFLATDLDIPNRLYQNNGDGTFEEIADSVGLASLLRSRNALWFDYNGDHLLDLLVLGDCFNTTVCNTAIFLNLYQQTPEGNFINTTDASGLTFNDQYVNFIVDFSAGGLAAADINNDGYLEILISTWGGKKHLFLNNGDETFSDITLNSNIGLENKFHWQPIFYDFNNDGFIDLYCNIDFENNELWLNNQDNTFNEVGESYGASNAFNEMGMTLGDFDNDSDMDIYATNITRDNTHNILLKNNTNNGQFINFSEESSNYGIADSGFDWGTTFFDANNDGWLDLATTNGKGTINFDPSKLWLNIDGSFSDISNASNFNDLLQGTSLLAFDMERDGDLDLLQTLKITTNNKTPVYIHENQLINNETNYLVVKPRMLETNHFAIGTVIKITIGNLNQMRLITAGTSFFGQEPAEAFFGLADHTLIDVLQIKWPDGSFTTLESVDANQVLVVDNSNIDEQVYGCTDSTSCNYNPLANVDDGSCEYLIADEISGNISSAFYKTDTYSYNNSNGTQVTWTVEGGELIDGQGTSSIIVTWDFVEQGKISAIESSNSCSSNASELFINLHLNNLSEDISIARIWNEALLEAIRDDYARPTVHARNLFHSSIALYDVWAIYDDESKPYLVGNQVHNFTSDLKEFSPSQTKELSETKAMSYATYRLLTHRFQNSPGADESLERFGLIMSQLGYDTGNTSVDYELGDAAALGNYVAQTIIDYGYTDNSREITGYDNAFYQPVNPALDLNSSGAAATGIVVSNRWQPLTFNTFIDQSGNLIEGSTPAFLSPEWGAVHPFALSETNKETFNRDGDDYIVYYNAETPPQLSGSSASSREQYKWNFALVSLWSSHLDPADGVLWDISPKSIGNIDINLFPSSYADYPGFYNELEGGDISIGHNLNPITGQAYETQMVPRADYARVLAEFWADGPDSETPPGHWFTILNYVTDHALFTRKFNGQGDVLSPLEWDVKAYFILAGALHDSAITAWGIKGWHDYIRPISAIRYMCELGQSTDNSLPNYNPEGIDLKEGYIDIVEFGDPLSGINDEHIGKIKLKAWNGHDFISNATTDVAGVGWILAENWWPYQRPSFVTPPFAGFISGHSTFSRAAAEVMTLITGDEFFPGGMGEFVAKKDEFLVFEKGPSVDVTLQWATYRDASDQTSLSRIWGGIHPPADDILGRIIGEQIGIEAYNFAVNYFSGKQQGIDETKIFVYPNPVSEKLYFRNLKEKSVLLLFSINGQVIFHDEIVESSYYDMSKLSEGIYLIKISNSQQQLNQLIIKL